MKYRLYLGFILLLLMGCGKSSTTAPSDFTISAPASVTESFSNLLYVLPAVKPYTLPFVVKDASGKPRQGVEVRFYIENATLYTDESFNTIATTPYKVETDSSGVAKAYIGILVTSCSITADLSYTVTLTGNLETTSAKWTDVVTVKKCGT